MGDESTIIVSMRIPRLLREALGRRATADARSLSNYVVRILTKHVEETAEPEAVKSARSKKS